MLTGDSDSVGGLLDLLTERETGRCLIDSIEKQYKPLVFQYLFRAVHQ